MNETNPQTTEEKEVGQGESAATATEGVGEPQEASPEAEAPVEAETSSPEEEAPPRPEGPTFADMGMSEPVLKALGDVGYETPTPIQARIIPMVLAGRDVLGQAQTGTGKTAAFALPLLTRLKPGSRAPKVLVLVPTRELALQVAEAFQRYASHMRGFHVLPVYGGQDYKTQLNRLRRGVDVIVGTPGRVMDHMERGTLVLEDLECLVLDEADEMLRMGFIDDVTWILEKTPSERQIALFSATMPDVIRRIANKHLRDPEQVTIQVRTITASTIRQRYWMVSGMQKLEALTRILEVEESDGLIIFVRTRTATAELAEKLEARGFATAALSGDVSQAGRERTISRLKSGEIDIVVATDVAARGLDVDRISHVINYDVPYDSESYVHRIGRTGRAGRSGEAILFVTPREKRMLFAIERAVGRRIERMRLPTTDAVNDRRIARFKQKITDVVENEDLEIFQKLVDEYEQEHDISSNRIAAALARLLQGETPLLLKEPPKPERSHRDRDRRGRHGHGHDHDMQRETYRFEVGRNHGANPGSIVGAIANETGISGSQIGRIRLYDDYGTVDLPAELFEVHNKKLKRIRIGGQRLKMVPWDGPQDHGGSGNKKYKFQKKNAFARKQQRYPR